jgi:outer membrane scaffolding protein for murein synthesis (MipA/OmpV family)
MSHRNFMESLMIRPLALAALSSLVALAPAAPRAQGLLDIGPGAILNPGPDPRWTLTLGALGALRPDYEGSSDYGFGAFPIIDLRYGELFFASVRDGIGINVIRTDWLQLAPVVRYRFGRDQDDNDALRGLGDVDGTVEVGLLATIGPGPWRLRLEGVQGVNGGGHGGFFARADLSYGTRVTERLFVSAGPSVTWTDGDFTQTYFGITPEQSRRSGYRVYGAGAGFKDVGVGLTANYSLGSGFSLTGIAEVKQLLGDAADSPIVREETQGFLGLGISWRGSL